MNKELEKIVRDTEVKFLDSYLKFADKALENNSLSEAIGFLAKYQTRRYELKYKGKEIDELNKRHNTLFETYMKKTRYEFFREKHSSSYKNEVKEK